MSPLVIYHYFLAWGVTNCLTEHLTSYRPLNPIVKIVVNCKGDLQVCIVFYGHSVTRTQALQTFPGFIDPRSQKNQVIYRHKLVFYWWQLFNAIYLTILWIYIVNLHNLYFEIIFCMFYFFVVATISFVKWCENFY